MKEKRVKNAHATGKPPASRRPNAGATAYSRQKGIAYSNFRVRTDELARISASQFTLYNFITDAFPFSPAKKEMAVRALGLLSEKPLTFTELRLALNAPKSSAYLLCLSLEHSGLVEHSSRAAPYRLSKRFSSILEKYASWWAAWVAANERQGARTRD